MRKYGAAELISPVAVDGETVTDPQGIDVLAVLAESLFHDPIEILHEGDIDPL